MPLVPRPTLLAVALSLATLGAAQATTITREFTAAWHDPSRSGQGIGLEVIESAGGKSAAIYWFTYDAAGRQMWLFGTAPVIDDSVSMTLTTTQGGASGTPFQPGGVQAQTWGTATLSFDDCNRGRLSFDPANPSQPSGVLNLVRLTRLYNGNCTGGVADDRRPGSDDTELVEFLANLGRYPAARAKARFEERATRTEFSVELEDLPIGAYELLVDGSPRATIRVATTARGTEGEVEFRSPVEPGKQLLDFDPRGAAIEIREASTALFQGLFDGNGAGGGAGSGGGGGGSGGGTAPPAPGGVERGSGFYELVLEPAGNDGPELHAKLEQRSDRVDFSVELEDVPTGAYTLRSDGVVRGTIEVVTVQGGTEGELEFRDPVETGKLLLDFDPRGKSLSVQRAGGSTISGTFPLQPTGASDDDDGGDDDSPGNGGGSSGGGGGGSGGGGGGTTPPSGGTASVTLVSTGVDADAHGSASYEATSNEREFEVEVEDLPDGTYQLFVGGTQRATINVVDEEGEVKFNDPARSGRLLLDFDPRGALIEVSRNGTVYVRGTLP